MKYKYKVVGHNCFYTFTNTLQGYYDGGWEPVDRAVTDNGYWFQTIRKEV
jgi:hypothetical protein